MMSKSAFMMATLLLATCVAFPAAANDADAKAPAKAATSHDKEGDRHEPAEGTQQHKMKVCNVQAHEKDLHGDERREFMSRCLRK